MTSILGECTGNEPDFAVGTVRGIRKWNVLNNGTLRAVSYVTTSSGGTWQDGQNTAVCFMEKMSNKLGVRHGPVASPRCTCGFYAYYDGTIYAPGRITGIIEGYGHVTVGTKGFRCEKAIIRALYLPTPKSLTFSDFLVFGSLFSNFCVLIALLFQGSLNLVTVAVLSMMMLVIIVFAAGAIKVVKERNKNLGAKERDYCKIIEKYPSAEIFTSRRKMLKAYPPHGGGFVRMKRRHRIIYPW